MVCCFVYCGDVAEECEYMCHSIMEVEGENISNNMNDNKVNPGNWSVCRRGNDSNVFL